MTPTMEQPKQRIFCIKTGPSLEVIRVVADTICKVKDGAVTVVTLKRGGEVVGEISGLHIDWWIEEEESRSSK